MVTHPRSPTSLIAMAGLMLVACSGCSDPVQTGASQHGSDLENVADNGRSALLFNGSDANTSTPLGTIVTTQIDDIAFDAMVRFDGPNALNRGQMVFYNGHGGVSGWGILVIGASDGYPDGTISILAGGIVVAPTPLRFTPGKWQHVQASRRRGAVTVMLDDQAYALGDFPVNPVAAGYRAVERTSIGGDGTFTAPTGDFHGAIDNVRIKNLLTNTWIERWMLDEGHGTTTTGANGTVLGIGYSTWTTR